MNEQENSPLNGQAIVPAAVPKENKAMGEQTVSPAFSPEDIEKNKVVSALAYIIFFLPLIVCPDSQFGKYHTNQGLLLLLASIGGSIVLSIIPIIGWIILPLFSIAVLIIAVIALINTLNGKAKELPIIGKFRILK